MYPSAEIITPLPAPILSFGSNPLKKNFLSLFKVFELIVFLTCTTAWTVFSAASVKSNLLVVLAGFELLVVNSRGLSCLKASISSLVSIKYL